MGQHPEWRLLCVKGKLLGWDNLRIVSGLWLSPLLFDLNSYLLQIGNEEFNVTEV